ncbi:MAG: VCBS repeat-containing protein [Chitinophagales bacterium]|nr:VCBS repeat-containing protein [Chitinophagales bacterium]
MGNGIIKEIRFLSINFQTIAFLDATDSLGFHSEFYGMGVGVGDINYDAHFEYYFTNIGDNSFYQKIGNEYKNVADSLQVMLGYNGNEKSTSWTGLFLDADNDMDLDLMVVRGYLESFENAGKIDYNKLMINENGKFIDKSFDLAFCDSIPNRGAAFLDFDHDGDLDIVVNTLQSGRSEFANLTQKIKLYKNELKQKNNWIAIKLVGNNKVNGSAIGCSVKFNINGKWYVREVDGGSGIVRNLLKRYILV